MTLQDAEEMFVLAASSFLSPTGTMYENVRSAIDELSGSVRKRVSGIGKRLRTDKNLRSGIQKLKTRIAQVLVDYHGVPLDEGSVEFLCERYGADREVLNQMNPGDRAVNYSLPYLNLPKLLDIPPLGKQYWQLIDSALKGQGP